jgi:dynamin 1-like protein
MGIRRLIELGLDRLHEPTTACVRSVDRVLQSMVERAVERRVGDVTGTSSLLAKLGLTKKKKPTADGINGGGGGGGGGGGSSGGDTNGSEITGEALRRFPSLRRAVVAAAHDALERHKREAETMVTAMVDMEASYFDADFFRRFSSDPEVRSIRTPVPRATASARCTPLLEDFTSRRVFQSRPPHLDAFQLRLTHP